MYSALKVGNLTLFFSIHTSIVLNIDGNLWNFYNYIHMPQ